MSTIKTKVLICPYCGDTQAAGERCRVCGGLFEPLSRQASHNAMGPWFVRDEHRPFQPGASYETIVKLVERGQINRYSILRGPTTKQFWTVARRVPGISHLLGYCHNCDASVSKDDHGCPTCGVPFGAYLDRNYLGLPEVKPLPWEAPVVDERRSHVVASVPTLSASPMVDFRRAAEPLGLSSFASDDELRGLASRPAPAYPSSGATAIASSNGDGEPHAPIEPPDPAFASVTPGEHASESQHTRFDSVNSVAARAMQRRLQNQQQTIRLLMLVVGVVTVLAIAAIVIMIVRSGQADGGSESGGGTNSTSEKSAAPASAGNSSAAGENRSPSATAATAPAQPLETSESATSLPADELAAPPAEAADSINADYERAAALMIEAKREDRLLKDRIRDAETAASLLKNIKQKASPADRPKSIDEEIAAADRLVEKLKLQEFFP